jgi:dihydroorotate dehydrogenase (NAD+) catalytic subunit
MFKRDLYFSKPLMNAAGMLGFAPDERIPAPWAEFGAFVTNPLSLRRRLPAASPELVDYPGGFLLHSGLPNPGLESALKQHAARWARASQPVIVHLMADRPEETARMVRALERVENVLAVELGFAPRLAGDILMLAVEQSLGELPLVVNLPTDQMLSLGARLVDAGVAALSLSAPRGALPRSGESSGLVTGRIYGPSLFAPALEVVYSAARLGLPVIGAGGVYQREQASAMLEAGALAVQLDAVLWSGSWGESRLTR